LPFSLSPLKDLGKLWIAKTSRTSSGTRLTERDQSSDDEDKRFFTHFFPTSPAISLTIVVEAENPITRRR